MSSKRAPKPREKKRRAITKRVKVLVYLRQKGRCSCGCGARLPSIKIGQFDHDPPLELRPWNATHTDTVPPANDPGYIFHMTTECHGRKTHHPRGPHTSIDSDRHSIDKSRRILNGGRTRKGPPFPGSKSSPFKIRLTSNGRKVERRKRA